MGIAQQLYTKNFAASEQEAIVRHLDVVSKQIVKSILNIKKQIKTLTKYRQSLIHECVTGKKRIYLVNPINGD